MTIGVTINLYNYENVRLEVEDVCPTLAEVDDLKAYLDGILAGLGRSEENTRRKIDQYRARLLVPAKDPTTRAPVPPPPAKTSPAKDAPLPPEEVEKNRQKAESLGLEPPAATPGLTAQEAAACLVKTGEVLKAAGVVATVVPDTGIVCEECGTPISTTQEKLSVMFLSKTLCKTCMDLKQTRK